MPKISRVRGASNSSGQVEPPEVYFTAGSPVFDGPVRCNDDLQVFGDFGVFGTSPATQANAITDATTAHALNATFSDTEVETALNALGTKVNAVLDVLQRYGLIAT